MVYFFAFFWNDFKSFIYNKLFKKGGRIMKKLTEEQKKLIEENMNLVYFVVDRYFKNSYFFVEKEELIQEGFFALCRCIFFYDEKRGKISTFIVKCVKSHLAFYIMRKMKKNIQTCDISKVENVLKYDDNYNYSTEKQLEEFLKRYIPEPEASAAADFYIHNMNWEEVAKKYSYRNKIAACSLVRSKMKRISENTYLKNKYKELFI